jgi:hypothetical protein
MISASKRLTIPIDTRTSMREKARVLTIDIHTLRVVVYNNVVRRIATT